MTDPLPSEEVSEPATERASELSDAWIDARTATFARSRANAAAEDPDSVVAAVLVRAAGATYALDLRWLRAVRSLRRLARLPHAPPHVAGLASYEGAVLPVFHLAAVLGTPLSTLPERGQMVVLGDDGDLVGAAVDEVGEGTNLDLNTLSPPPATFPERLRLVVQGVTRDGVVLLDVAALLAGDRMVVGVAARFARPGASGGGTAP
jgi:purine-binding chemotaxis protein CheW